MAGLKGWKWNTKRRRAAEMLATGETQRDVAEKLKLSERTLHYWVATPEFDSYLIELENTARESATRVLRRHGIKAAEKLAELMQWGSRYDNVQLRAATALLARIGVAPLTKVAATDPTGENEYAGLSDDELRQAIIAAAGELAASGEVSLDDAGEAEPEDA